MVLQKTFCKSFCKLIAKYIPVTPVLVKVYINFFPVFFSHCLKSLCCHATAKLSATAMLSLSRTVAEHAHVRVQAQGKL